jgi:hypothetical protein
MGKARNGIFGAVNGKVGNLVFYKLHGEDVVRQLGERTGKLSAAQQANCSKMALIVSLFSKIKPFLKVGFGIEARGTNKNYHNLATAYNKANAFEMQEGKPVLKYEQLLLSYGDLKPPRAATLEVLNGGIRFSWAYEEQEDWASRNDQVMMMAYFPDDNEASFSISGARRSKQSDLLDIHSSYSEKRTELYISFVSDDRGSVATSIYLGRIN